MEKSALLDKIGAEGEDRMTLANVLDRAQQAQNRNTPAITGFLSPALRLRSRDLLKLAGFGEETYTAFGGYEGAERQILLFLPDWLEADQAAEQAGVRCVRAAFRREDKLTHRDLLGSLMGLGLTRERIGDILVSPGSADILALDAAADFLLQSWTQAGRAKLRVEEVPLSYIHIPAAAAKEIHDTVSSLRLDAVLSSGLQLARGKAADLITGGRVEVNWRECAKADHPVSTGDTITARGYGKMELTEVGGLTKKGRIAITLKRYL